MCQGADIRSQKTYGYTPEQGVCVDDHIARHFGKVTQVIEDPSPVEPKIDLLIINPSLCSNFFTIVTRGMGSYMPKLTTKEDGTKDSRANKRYELVLCLEKSWVINEKSTEGDVWPIRLLLRLCHYPYVTDKLISAGISFDNDKKFASSTNLSAVVLEELSTYFSSAARNCLLPNYELVHFLQVLPLYKAELDFLDKFGIENFRRHMLQESFIVENCRKSGVDLVYDYYANVTCDSRWYDRCTITRKKYLTECLTLSHLAWFVRFCYESDLLSTDFYNTFAAYKSDLEGEVLAKQFLDLVSNQLGGIIDRRYFNAAGEHFAVIYLDSNNYPSYISDLEDIALNRFGMDKYFNNGRQIKSAIDLDYDETTFSVIRNVLKQRYASINHQVLYDCDTNHNLVTALCKHLACSTTFYPSLMDPSPILAQIRNATRMSYFQEGYPVLVEVTAENLYRMLKLARNNVSKVNSDDFALECEADDLTFDHDFSLAIKEVNFSLQDSYRNNLSKPLTPNYYNHIFNLLKEAFSRSKAAQYAFKELILIYDEQISTNSFIDQNDLQQYACYFEDNTHIDLGYKDNNNGQDPFELRATYDKKQYKMVFPAESFKHKEETKARTNMAITKEDTQLNIFDLKSIYRDHDGTTKPFLLAQIPVRTPYDSLGYLPYIIETPNFTIQQSLDVFSAWYLQFGAMPMVFCTHMVEFITTRPINSDEAWQLTYEIIAMCPKVRLLLDDGAITMEQIHDDIDGTNSFTLDFSPVVRSYNKPYGY